MHTFSGESRTSSSRRPKARAIVAGVTIATGLTVAAGTAGLPAASAHTNQRALQAQHKQNQFNDADVMFLSMMIPHHGQALEMADMAKAKATMPEVRRLAASINRSQSREIDYMSDLLRAWGQPVPDPMGGMDHHMPGMMSQADMDELAAADGMEFATCG